MTELLAFTMGIIVVLASIIVYQQATKQFVQDVALPSQSLTSPTTDQTIIVKEVMPSVIHVNTNQNSFTPPVVFGQVGYLSSNGSILPLYGEPSQTRRGRYYYYTIANGIKLAVIYNKRDCMEDIACEEVYDGEQIKVQSLGDTVWTVKIYSNTFSYRY